MAFDYRLIAAFINGINRGAEQALSATIHHREYKAWEREWESREQEHRKLDA